MKIGSQHVYKIWRSLVEYRNCVEAPPSAAVQTVSGDYLYAMLPAASVDGGSSAAAVVISPNDRQVAGLQSAAGADVRLYDEARPHGRPIILLKDDHNYC